MAGRVAGRVNNVQAACEIEKLPVLKFGHRMHR